MISALRSFFVTVSVIFLVLVLVFGFELVGTALEKSGFSSGAVFDSEYSAGVFSGEILGNRFSLDFSPLFIIGAMLGKLLFLLPPPLVMLIKLFGALI